MRLYDKLIFVCTSNTLLSPIAEGIYCAKAESFMPEAISRGLVVLFEEPISPKVNMLLSRHDIAPVEHPQSIQFVKEDVTENTLILTMTFPEKVQLMEEFGEMDNLYTLGEFAGIETDVPDPYGAEEEAYERCFEEIYERVDMTIIRMEDDLE
ncbi:MAG: hypothetical protein J1E62_06285 [Lachnospiraceae bacterium]|nr:hypothetical protein [Lachnospiraceae bacterium]